MKRRKYTIEFKREASRMMIIDGQAASAVSAQLGVNTNQLYRWRREHLERMEGSSPNLDPN
jgi:transposase